jgi:hypothetical protein
MYASITEICNVALSLLGQDPVNDIADSNDRARLCTKIWPMVLDDELSLHRWKCARKRAALAMEAATPAFGWAYQYALPSGCLRVLSIENDVDYEIEGNFLLTDNTSANVIYLWRNPTVGAYSPGLVSALVARMAAELSMPTTKKDSIVKASWAAYWSKVGQALAADGQQGTPEVLEDRTLLDASL